MSIFDAAGVRWLVSARHAGTQLHELGDVHHRLVADRETHLGFHSAKLDPKYRGI